jgi:hypothetical protein
VVGIDDVADGPLSKDSAMSNSQRNMQRASRVVAHPLCGTAVDVALVAGEAGNVGWSRSDSSGVPRQRIHIEE